MAELLNKSLSVLDEMARSMLNPDYQPDELFSLDQFAINGKSQEMRKQMLEDKYILGRIALLGQATVFYTERNGGKTLLTIWMLIDSIKNGVINASDVYYINSDDTYKGLIEKTELAEHYGFKMLSDGHNGFKNEMLFDYLEKLCDSDRASGKIVILDTLKKFANIMDKTKGSDFGKKLRAFVLKGGSLIMLAHVNKNRDDNGKLVFSGTTDIVDDADCAYIMDKVVQNGKTIVTFENFKARGDVVETAVYSFERKPDGGQSYADLLATVQPVTDDDLQQVKKQKAAATLLEKNSAIIRATLDAIAQGVDKRTELINEVHEQSGESKSKVTKALDAHTGDNWLAGHRWQLVKGEKNAKIYKPLFSVFQSDIGGVKNMESLES